MVRTAHTWLEPTRAEPSGAKLLRRGSRGSWSGDVGKGGDHQIWMAKVDGPHKSKR